MSWEPTMHLRWYADKDHAGMSDRLQQLWINVDYGQREWRLLPAWMDGQLVKPLRPAPLHMEAKPNAGPPPPETLPQDPPPIGLTAEEFERVRQEIRDQFCTAREEEHLKEVLNAFIDDQNAMSPEQRTIIASDYAARVKELHRTGESNRKPRDPDPRPPKIPWETGGMELWDKEETMARIEATLSSAEHPINDNRETAVHLQEYWEKTADARKKHLTQKERKAFFERATKIFTNHNL